MSDVAPTHVGDGVHHWISDGTTTQVAVLPPEWADVEKFKAYMPRVSRSLNMIPAGQEAGISLTIRDEE